MFKPNRKWFYKPNEAEYKQKDILKKSQSYFSNLSKTLNLQQQTALTLKEQYLLILAGAGTGKTTFVIEKIKWLIEIEKIKPSEILALSYTRDSAQELKDRLPAKVRERVHTSTFHSYCLQHIKEDVADHKLITDGANDETLIAIKRKALKTLSSSWKQKVFEALSVKNASSLYDLFYREYQLRLVSQNRVYKDSLKESSYRLFKNQWEELKAQNKILSFDDLIEKSIKKIMETSEPLELKFVLVDEFQDINYLRMSWLRALSQNNPSLKIWAVGDDWQSIYKFAGSRVDLLTDFNKYFKGARGFFFKDTYRYHSKIEEVSRQFVLKNKLQIPKKMECHFKSDDFAYTVFDSYYPIEGLMYLFESIQEKELQSVLVLGRLNADLPSEVQQKNLQTQYPSIDLYFKTIHSSKGLEADRVVLMVQGGVNGFPQLRDSDINEERRLYYVALTRAKKQIFFLQKKGKPSSFVSETIKDFPEYGIEILLDS
jgi:DNA helicase-4